MAAQKLGQSTEAIVSNAMLSYKSSALWMKRATEICLSTLMYNRGNIPVEDYTYEIVRGMRIHHLKNVPTTKRGEWFKKAMKWIFDAFDNKYLSELEFGIYGDDRDPKSLLEFYLLRYKYDGDDTGIVVEAGNSHKIISSIKLHLDDEVYEKTRDLLANGIGFHPPGKGIIIRLYLHDNRTPRDYCLQGCEPELNAEIDKLPIIAPITMGSISQVYENVNSHNETDVEDNPMSKQSTDAQASTSHSETNFDAPIRCPCNEDPAYGHSLIICHYCENWQHSVCFGLLPTQNPIGIHCCDECARANADLTCSCERIMSIESPDDRMIFCQLRRAIIICMESRAVNELSLSQFHPYTAWLMMRILDKMGVFKPMSERKKKNPFNKRAVNMTKLKKLILEFFRYNEPPTKEDPVEDNQKMMKKMARGTRRSTQSKRQTTSMILRPRKRSQEHIPVYDLVKRR